MSKIRVGVIGAGAWATASHLPTLLTRRDELELVGVCRKGPAELRAVADTFGFPLASEDYRDVLGAGIDLCVVASPAALHFEHAKAALESGSHVLLEKPVTLRSDQAWQLVDLAERTHRHVVVAFGWNHMTTFREALSLWGRHGVGRVEHIMLHMASGIRELLRGTSVSSTGKADDAADTQTYTDPGLAGGGYAQTQLSHAFGLLLGLTGLRVAEVFCLESGPPDAPVELHDAMAIRFRGGASGAVSGASYHAGVQGNRHQLEVRVFGSTGQIHIDLERDRLWLSGTDGEDVEVALPRDAGAYECVGPPLALVDLILGRATDNPSPLELGARTVEVLEAAGRSAREGRLITI